MIVNIRESRVMEDRVKKNSSMNAIRVSRRYNRMRKKLNWK